MTDEYYPLPTMEQTHAALMRTMGRVQKFAHKYSKAPTARAMMQASGPRVFTDDSGRRCHIVTLGVFSSLHLGAEYGEDFDSTVRAFDNSLEAMQDICDCQEYLVSQGIEVHLTMESNLTLARIYFTEVGTK